MKKIAYKKVEQIENMKINNLIRCMKNIVFPQMMDEHGKFAGSFRYLLPEHWIGQGGCIAWPLRYSGQTSLDFFHWEYNKKTLFTILWSWTGRFTSQNFNCLMLLLKFYLR